ncbi:MAG TPA: hypothetical protein VGE74_29595 [Gemmata sp.]
MPEYPQALAELLRQAPPTVLGPGAPDTAVRAQLKAASETLPPACAAGVWLRFDFLDESHAISQADESCPDRNFWHAILHRREPDAWNSKYWWRRVGAHPVLDQLAAQAPAVGYAYTTPAAFVDFCERVRGSGSAEEATAKRVQQLEWDLLFAWCFERAGGN